MLVSSNVRHVFKNTTEADLSCSAHVVQMSYVARQHDYDRMSRSWKCKWVSLSMAVPVPEEKERAVHSSSKACRAVVIILVVIVSLLCSGRAVRCSNHALDSCHPQPQELSSFLLSLSLPASLHISTAPG